MAYGKTLQAIASFSTEGEIKPLYFKIDGVQLKVTRAKVANHISGHTEYICHVDDGGIEKPLRVGYADGERKWRILT